jgi:hypothetical protein
MDWEKIDLPDPKERSPKSGKLSNLDYYKLLVASRIIRKSIMATIQTAILTYLGRNWSDHEDRLKLEAKQRGMTPEQLFEAIAKDEINL